MTITPCLVHVPCRALLVVIRAGATVDADLPAPTHNALDGHRTRSALCSPLPTACRHAWPRSGVGVKGLLVRAEVTTPRSQGRALELDEDRVGGRVPDVLA